MSVFVKDKANATHTVHGIGKCLGVLQEFLRGDLEDGKVTLEVVELWIGGLWRWRSGKEDASASQDIECRAQMQTGRRGGGRWRWRCLLLDMPTFEPTMCGVLSNALVY